MSYPTVYMCRSEVDWQRLAESIDASKPPSLDAVGEIGCYRILRQLGRGGSGTVYAAYDPRLDRCVALKLLPPSASPSSRKRLEREARALAKLSHPNIVQVYHTGMHNNQVFMAMELIEGQPLSEWLKRQPRPSWPEVLRVSLQAARGIAAAHKYGLIHRDIKPANILIGQDGRVRVADFGLATMHTSSAKVVDGRPPCRVRHTGAGSRLTGGVPTRGELHTALPRGRVAGCPGKRREEVELLPNGAAGRPAIRSAELSECEDCDCSLDERITQPGVVMGTPPFMAPEQCLGAGLGPATDQYSFCVSLYIGLYGTFPFEVDSSDVIALQQCKMRGEIEPPPPDSGVPAWLHPVIARGLAPSPADRYPSMDQLIAALERDSGQSGGKRVRFASLLGCAMVVAGMYLFTGTQNQDLVGHVCEGVDRALAGVWDTDIRERARAAFSATGLAYAPDAFARVSAVLDEYAASWVSTRTRACEAAQVHTDQSPTILPLRDNCLDRRLRQLGTLTHIFATATDRRLAATAVQTAQALPAVEDCADVDALTGAIQPPDDPQLRARIAALQERVDHMEILHRSGKYREGLLLGKSLHAELADIDYPPIHARAMYWLATLRISNSQYRRAENLLREAIPFAARARDDVLIARQWSLLFWLIGSRQARYEEAMALQTAVVVAVERADDEVVRATSLSRIGSVLRHMGKYKEARSMHQRALAAIKHKFGPDHPRVAAILNNLGNVFMAVGKYEKARAIYQRALTIRKNALGSDHPDVATSLNSLGRVSIAMGQYEKALALYARALALREAIFGPAHPKVASALIGRGRALVDVEARASKSSPMHATKRLDVAQRHLMRALAIAEKTTGPRHRIRAEALLGLAEVANAQGRQAKAVSLLEHCLALEVPTIHARVQQVLATVLWNSTTDRARAISLATKARDHYQRVGNQPRRAEASRQLAEYCHQVPKICPLFNSPGIPASAAAAVTNDQ